MIFRSILSQIFCSVFCINIKGGEGERSRGNHSLFDSIRWFSRTNNTKRTKMWKNEECGTSCVQLFHKRYKRDKNVKIEECTTCDNTFTNSDKGMPKSVYKWDDNGDDKDVWRRGGFDPKHHNYHIDLLICLLHLLVFLSRVFFCR